MLEQQLVNGLSLGCVYALFALGFTLVFGVLGVVNLSHGAMFMVGAYAAERATAGFGWGIASAMAFAFVVAGVAGLLVDVLVLRRLRQRQAPHLIPMVATIGVAIVINSAAQGIFGAENRRYPEEVISHAAYTFGSVQVTVLELGIMLASATLMAALFMALRGTQIGRGLRAVAESPRAAYLVGINVEKMFFITSF
ncbi:branched-chain amino acid ABC transporter permease, partial [Streptococcus pyogenes]|uniref:branched-chain amino acid ABC transporter permease n=1 Tax=Streptococcus pyogenes TaxID=1314 RepID=UPI003DA06B0B